MTADLATTLASLLGDGPLHPAAVHVPLGLAVVMPLVAGLVMLGAHRNWWSNRVWVIVLVLQAALVGSAWAASSLGEEDEERVEKVVPEERIHEHEEAAELFTGAAAGVLGLGVLVLVLSRRPAPMKAVRLLAFAGTVAVLALGLRAGKLGGELVYRHGAAEAHRLPPR